MTDSRYVRPIATTTQPGVANDCSVMRTLVIIDDNATGIDNDIMATPNRRDALPTMPIVTWPRNLLCCRHSEPLRTTTHC